jgi:hypothetical protein
VQESLKNEHEGGRRGFLKWLALGAAGAAAYSFISRKVLPGVNANSKPIPSNLPGTGSIFQPRGDRRRSR